MAKTPIEKGQDFYVPHFQLKLQGRPQGQEVVQDILSVTYKDDIEEIDSFDITINNWDAKKRTFNYSDDDLFDPGKEVELWMGYYGGKQLRLMIRGEITSLRPSFPAGGSPTLVISGLNLLHKFRTKQESHIYEKMSDSQIAKKIGGRLSLTVETNSTAAAQEPKYEYLFQQNQYDIIFLMQRARQIGYDMFVKESEHGKSKLYFGPSDNVKQVACELKYGRSLIQFQPTLTTANQVSEVTVRGWNVKDKKMIEYTSKRSSVDVRGVGSAGGQAKIDKSFNQRKEIITDKPIESEAEAKQLAEETLERIAKDMVKGSGSTVGLPDLRAGSVVEIDGLGKRFSGRYFVTQTTHTINDSGYTTSFECRREEV